MDCHTQRVTCLRSGRSLCSALGRFRKYWAKHRGNDRYARHLMTLFESSVMKSLLPAVSVFGLEAVAVNLVNDYSNARALPEISDCTRRAAPRPTHLCSNMRFVDHTVSMGSSLGSPNVFAS
eukprot:4914423-Pyramimonas_sp.AAC.1